MKIFLLCPYYLNLYIPIVEEFERNGHKVYVCEDVLLPHDTYFKNTHVRLRRLKRIFLRMTFFYERYWRKKMSENKTAFQDKYDIFLCINGISFDPYLLRILKANNPTLRTFLYLWDTNRFYDYFRNRKYFQHVFSFDYEDAKTEGVDYLPNYWITTPDSQLPIKYALSMIGSNHDGRIGIVSNIANQLKEMGMPYYMKVFVGEARELTANEKVDYDIAIKNNNQEMIEMYEAKMGITHQEYTTTEMLSVSEVNRILLQSNCILDTDRSSQTGLTPRLIWALALGKKVITTNMNIKKMPFYNSKQIMLIDRKHPIVDKQFLSERQLFPTHPFLITLRIDNWVKNFIGK